MDDRYIVLISLIASALFSGMEIAFLSTNRLQLVLDVKKNNFSAVLINNFVKHQSQFIGCLLLGNNIANVIYGIEMSKILEPQIVNILPDVISNEFTVLLCQTILSTLLILIVGEFMPKIIFRINPNKLMDVFALPATILYVILYPLIIIYIGISEFIIKYVFRIKVGREDYKFNTVDLNDYIKEYANTEDEDEDIQQGIELFQKAMDFHNVKLRECMVPRTDIEAVRSDDSMETIISKFEETKHSKLLVYENNIDNIIGYVHINDIFVSQNDVMKKLRHIEFYPETYSAQELLKHLSQTHQSIAIVVDEFGGTSGVITIEDLVEEIFGEIEDEYDDDDLIEKTIDDNDHVFSARMEIDYLNETYKFNFPESDDYETLAGYILHYHGSIPKTNEEIIIGNYIFKIIKATETKLEEIEVKNNQ